MSRSAWKGPYVRQNLKNKKVVTIFNRSFTILPIFVGCSFRIYTGRKFFTLKIKSSMIGYKLGDFAFTRKKFSYSK